MEGYIKSRNNNWVHIFKMSIRPGGEVPLNDLYEMYGKKYNISEDKFVQWLKDVKLKGKTDQWQIVETDSKYESETQEIESAPKKVDYEINTKGEVVARKMSVDDIINLPVRKAREVIPTIMDEKLLRYSLQTAKPKPGKDSLCRILEKRLSELNIPM